VHWYFDVLKQYAVFDGRARRAEYWWFQLFNVIVIAILAGIDEGAGTYPLFVAIYALATLLPTLGVTIRRLHDTSRSGWWILVGFIPIIGALLLLVFYIQPSHLGDNEYGPSPAV
jgi:uncharacterized membrane protein YhaH (DUF805 family)